MKLPSLPSRKFVALCALGILTAVGATLYERHARAQIEPLFGLSYGVYEGGVLVGEIYRADTDPSRYTEHWVLYPAYVYPNATNGVAIEIRPGAARYRDINDFFQRVPWTRGSHYVKSDNLDGTTLPGR